MRSRGYLPHYDRPGLIQFVTFRLADSLPSSTVAEWEAELARLSREEARQKLQRRIQSFLDTGHGEAHLARRDVAEVVQNSLRHDAGSIYDLRAWVIMPNHVHVILRVRHGHTLSKAMQRVKGASAHGANRLLGRTGTFWAREYYDRYARDTDHLTRAIAYVRANPVKAGLCATPEDWPWLGEMDLPGGDEVVLPPTYSDPRSHGERPASPGRPPMS